MLKKYSEKIKELFIYGVVGAAVTLLNIAIYALCAKVLHFDTVPAVLIAWFVACVVAFWGNKLIVFKSGSMERGLVWREFLSFFAMRAVTGIFDVVFMYITVKMLYADDMIMKIVSNVIVIVLNYVFSKLVIFKNKN